MYYSPCMYTWTIINLWHVLNIYFQWTRMPEETSFRLKDEKHVICRFVGNKRYLIVVLTVQEINWRNRQQNGCNSANYLYFWTTIYIIIYICICNEKIRILALHENSLTDIWTKLCVSTWIFRVIHIIYIIRVLKVKGTYS